MVAKKLKCSSIVKTSIAYAQYSPQLYRGIYISDLCIFIYEIKALFVLFRIEVVLQTVSEMLRKKDRKTRKKRGGAYFLADTVRVYTRKLLYK